MVFLGRDSKWQLRDREEECSSSSEDLDEGGEYCRDFMSGVFFPANLLDSWPISLAATLRCCQICDANLVSSCLNRTTMGVNGWKRPRKVFGNGCPFFVT
eukprot:gnl/TRDRNA2_/TRDRNA2_141818_c0_seq1.p2 gnl/TRDRNA2_/TRDRNA2_141818_c0~~gnl/TRDRNA2_/TRDRNA2_141818_c0_seq1.p2  ORF type:complete len:100 (+),score=1.96 gnl/TRDRNA2_/TRDRNA2_141818_c0_seq1:220-519(+)